MKKINTLLALLSALLLLGACEKDGEKFYLSSPVESDLIASTNAVVLTEATAKLYALSLAWSDQTLQISDPRYQATSGIQTTVQVSRSEDFSGSIIESTENGVSKSYTVAALNIIAYKLMHRLKKPLLFISDWQEAMAATSLLYIAIQWQSQ